MWLSWAKILQLGNLFVLKFNMFILNITAPIIIIVSLGVMLFIIRKKIPQLAALSEEQLLEYEQRRATRRIIMYFFQRLENFFSRLKIAALKIYNYSHTWTTFLKEKKNGSNGHNNETTPP